MSWGYFNMGKDNNRSKGVTLTGWLLILGGSAYLIQPFINLRAALNYLCFGLHSSLQLIWLISTAILAGFIFGGIRILKLQELGKGLVVFLAIIDIPHLVVGKAIYNNWYAQPIYLRNYFLIPVSILINFALIHFLNHPKVRRQFK